jgi:hypothetical protein
METWRRLAPWAQAAAAVLLFVAGMGVSQLQFGYGTGVLTVRYAPPSRLLFRGAHHSPRHRRPAAFHVRERSGDAGGSRSASADEMLQRVKALIDQSESRQQRQLALRSRT